MISLLLLACNTAPLDTRTRSHCATPNDDACERRRADGTPVEPIGEFLFCGMENIITPVDDPRLVACSKARRPGDESQRVWHAFDGNEAKAYHIGRLHQRELVHDTLSGVPVLVDY